MGGVATLIEELREELLALAGLRPTDAVVADGRPLLHTLALGEELDLPADRVALIHNGQLALYREGRFDRTATGPDLGTWWYDTPGRLEALSRATVVSFDRAAVAPYSAGTDAATLTDRYAAAADALADERHRRDRLRERFQYGGDDPYLRVREPYTGRIESRQYVVRPLSWPWPGARPETALFTIADYDQVGSSGSDPEDGIDYRQATLWIPRDGGLQIVLAWADHARAVRVGRELFGFRTRFGRVEELDPSGWLLAVDGQPQLLARGRQGAALPATSWREDFGLPAGPLRVFGSDGESRWTHRPPESAFRLNEDRAWSLDAPSLDILDVGLGEGFEVVRASGLVGRFQIVPIRVP